MTPERERLAEWCVYRVRKIRSGMQDAAVHADLEEAADNLERIAAILRAPQPESENMTRGAGDTGSGEK